MLWRLLPLLALCISGIARDHYLERLEFVFRHQGAAFQGAGTRYLEALGGDVDAQFHAGFLSLHRGWGSNDTAEIWLTMAAERGHPFAAWVLADYLNRTVHGKLSTGFEGQRSSALSKGSPVWPGCMKLASS